MGRDTTAGSFISGWSRGKPVGPGWFGQGCFFFATPFALLMDVHWGCVLLLSAAAFARVD